MPDFHGPIQHVTPAATLWMLLACPLAAALACAWCALFGGRRRDDDRTRRFVARVSIASAALAFLASAAHAVALAIRPEGERFFLQHLWRMVRVGQLDASFDLALDPLASTMTLAVTGIALATTLAAAA